MPEARPQLTAREVAAEIDRINKRLGDRSISRSEYESLLKERNRQTRELVSVRQENDVLRARADDARAEYLRDQKALDKDYRAKAADEQKAYKNKLERELANVYGPADRNVYPVGANAEAARRREQAARRNQRGNIKPETKPQKPKDVDVGTNRDKNQPKPRKGPQGSIPTPSKGSIKLTPVISPIPPSVDSRQYNDATGDLIDAVTSGYDYLPNEIKNNPNIRPYLNFQTKVARDILNGYARMLPVATVVNTAATEFLGYKAKQAAQGGGLSVLAASAKELTNNQLAEQQQRMLLKIEENTGGIAAIVAMIQGLATNQEMVARGVAATVANTAGVPAILPAIGGMQKKLGAANFTLQNQAATLTKAKLGAIDATRLMAISLLTEKKLNTIDATQLMTTSRLAEKKLNLLDATQLMTTSRLAEKKWNILDATQLMTTSRLAEKKWNILDATQLMGTSRTAEKKWSIIDATQLMKDTRRIPALFQELQKPLKIPTEIARKSDLAAIKFPTIPNDLARKSDLKPVVIPNDLARKSDIANIRFPNVSPIVNLPAPIVNLPAPDIGGFVQAVNQTLNQQTTNITNIFNRSYQGLTQENLNQAVGNVNNYTNAVANTVINQVNNHTTRQSSEVTTAVGAVAQQAQTISADVGDVAKVIGVPQLKPGLSVKPDADLKAIGVKTDNGNAPDIVKNLPQMMMMLAAVPYVRQGLHRLGGSFDTSVMNPQKGKTKITDTLGFQQWQFNQIDERMGMPSTHTVLTPGGQTQSKTFRSMEDALEENNANTVVALQDLEVVERYLFALTQDVQKLMQIVLQTRGDVDVLIDDAGCKVKEMKRSHPTHINLTTGPSGKSLSGIFQPGLVHYVARQWDDSADKNQKLERMSYDTQIAAMSNKFEFNKTDPELPLQKSRATDKPLNDELWRTYVSTMEEPPEGYTSPGNPIPDIKEIKNGNPKDVPRPTNPLKKLGKS
jgi:hypothetical protein